MDNAKPHCEHLFRLEKVADDYEKSSSNDEKLKHYGYHFSKFVLEV